MAFTYVCVIIDGFLRPDRPRVPPPVPLIAVCDLIFLGMVLETSTIVVVTMPILFPAFKDVGLIPCGPGC